MDMIENIKNIWDNSEVFKTKFDSFDLFSEWMQTKNAMYEHLGEEHGDFSGDVNKDMTPYEVVMRDGVLPVENHLG
jgi:hypothetical protein